MLNTMTTALKSAFATAMFLAMPAHAQTFSIPAAPPLTQKTDLGFYTPGFLEVSALGYVDLTSDTHYLVFADGATAIPYTGGTFTWTAEGGPYPTFAGGDGINHYRGGGTNWQGSFWNELGAQSTDSLNPATIRFGTLVGTFNPAPAASDWFVIGRHATIRIPAGGAHLYAAISDCATCRPDNAFAFAVTVGKRIYSLRDDFDSTHNPSGPWSYGFRLATDAPSVFTRFSTNYAGYQQVVGGWNGTDQPGNTLPGVAKNYSAASVTDGPTVWPANELNFHPGQTRDCVSRFTAPVSGTYRLSGTFRGLSTFGTTTTVLIRHGTTILYQTNVIGYQTVVNMPAQFISLNTGDVIDLTVTKGPNNDYSNDSTGVDLTVEVPRCIADFDDGSGTGTPDGGVGIEDLLYYLDVYTAGAVRADVDDGSGTGTPDGGVGIEDLLYFLARFTAGC